jgi:hypothetical protein
MALKADCDRLGVLPVSGALLDQPHILMRFFRIIEEERMAFELDKAKTQRRNRELREESKHAKVESSTTAEIR